VFPSAEGAGGAGTTLFPGAGAQSAGGTAGPASLSCPTAGGQSFTPATPVLLANGNTAPIASLKPGDKVEATSTATGKTSPETVTAVEVHHDTNLYDLNIKTPHGVQVIHTTASHLFWDPYLHQWRPANKLKKGEHLLTANGTSAVADGGSTPKVHDGWMWDLTVPGNNDHDFYVLPAQSDSRHAAYDVEARSASILVHNDDKSLCQILGISQVQLNRLVGNAYRDHIADSFTQRGLNVVTEETAPDLLRFNTPYGERQFDIGLLDGAGKVTDFIETKSGDVGQDALQALKDGWLEKNLGIKITYVYDGYGQ